MADVGDQPPEQLLDALRHVVRPWLCARVCSAIGVDDTAGLTSDTVAVIDAAATSILDALDVLLRADVDEQRENPLSVLRRGVLPINRHLAQLGCHPPRRDRFEIERLPSDTYSLTPANWEEVDPALTEVGLMWGAWKAATILSRRRANAEPDTAPSD